MSHSTTCLPTPHLDKLVALESNPRLPLSDRRRLDKAQERYHDWIAQLEAVPLGDTDAVAKLVGATNRYKRFIELDLIFDSEEDFLYRQRGQLKLDNTILEEFLPQLVFRSVAGIQDGFTMGPQSTFAGLSFTSTLGDTGKGGSPSIRTKNQDFVLGKNLYIQTSFDPTFQQADLVQSHLGYVCVECKTNLDKTMFQEAVATSRDLKTAAPSSLYFLVCEFLDMTPLSITSTHIDDVLIVRKAKRLSSSVRQRYRSSQARRQHRQEYRDYIEAASFHPDVFERMIRKIQEHIVGPTPTEDDVLSEGHF